MYSFQNYLLFAAALSASNTLAVLLPKPRINSCGVKGWSTNTDSYFYDDSGRYAGHDKCNAQCQLDTNCQSYAYDLVKTCMLYSVVVYGNFEADDDSPYYFYDRGCITPASSTSAATTIKSVFTTITSSKSIIKPVNLSTNTLLTASSAPTSSSSSLKILTTFSTAAAISNTSRASTTLPTSSPAPSTTKSSTTLSTRTITTSNIAAPSTSSIATTSKITTTTSTKSTPPSTTTPTIPSGCSIPPSYTITDFSWFNSTHNLDCIKGPDVGDGTGCLNTDAQGNAYWCDPTLEPNCTHCGIGLCMTGLPQHPVGYGPPDTISFAFSDGTSCAQTNTGEIRRFEIGEGRVNCGGQWDFLNFYGSSDAASQTGVAEVYSYPTTCDDGDSIYGYYKAEFEVDCSHDVQRNATCTTPRAVMLPLISYTKAKTVY